MPNVMTMMHCLRFKVAIVCTSFFLFLFHFLCKLIMLLHFFSTFKMWVKDFVCKLSVLVWTIALFVGGCLYNFLFVGKSRIKKKKRASVLQKRGLRKQLLNTLSFSLYLLFLPSFFIIVILSRNNFNIQIILEN